MVELHAVCYNEAEFLPYFFRHYNQFVDRYVIFDQGSNDGTREILRKNHIPVIIIDNYTKKFSDAAGLEFRHTAHKKLGHRNDWIIQADIDELIYAPDMARALQTPEQAIKADGFEMVSTDFEYNKSGQVYKHYREGVRSALYSKICVHRRGADVRYSVGMHTAAINGSVKQGGVKLLHYKYMGLKELDKRIEKRIARLSDDNIRNGWGLMDKKNEYEIYENLLKNAGGVELWK